MEQSSFDVLYKENWEGPDLHLYRIKHFPGSNEAVLILSRQNNDVFGKEQH